MIKIIFEDESILVIEKPSGVRSIADGYDPSIPYVRTIMEPEYGKLWIVHRLDKDTSGIMLLARNSKSHKLLNDQFSQRQIHKQYQALVFGVFPKAILVDRPLKVNGDRHHRTVVDLARGKPASTQLSIIQDFRESSLVLAEPHTGYSHQIRSHLLNCGFPILCDPLYFTPESKQYSLPLPLKRMALHASQITFEHPVTHQWITLQSPLPDDFQETIAILKNKGHQ